jgi:hypothetical protein
VLQFNIIIFILKLSLSIFFMLATKKSFLL